MQLRLLRPVPSSARQKDSGVPLSQSLKIVIQPEGQGYHALVSSEEIFAQAQESYVQEEEEYIA